ncbi:MAG: hypothetical protein ACI9RM_001418 [Ulvibacter sp.]|jgi:hypothetical protein
MNTYLKILAIIIMVNSPLLSQKPPIYDSVYIQVNNLIGDELQLIDSSYSKPSVIQPEYGDYMVLNWNKNLIITICQASNEEYAKGILGGMLLQTDLSHKEINNKNLDRAYHSGSLAWLGNSSTYLGLRNRIVFCIHVSNTSDSVGLSMKCGEIIAKTLLNNGY